MKRSIFKQHVVHFFCSFVNSKEMARQSKITNLDEPRKIPEGQEVYLNEQYYEDFHTTVLEVPRYGWRVKEFVNGEATIEYQRHNLKLLMCLTVDTKYLKKEA